MANYTSVYTGAEMDDGLRKSITQIPGAFISVQSTIERDAIPLSDRVNAKLVFVNSSTPTFYQWDSIGATWNVKNFDAVWGRITGLPIDQLDLMPYIRTGISSSANALTYDNMTGILSATTGYDMLVTSPSVDQVLRYNGSLWINGSATTVNGGSGVDYFYVNTASDIGGYYQLNKTPSSGGEVDDTVVVNSNKVLIKEFASPLGGIGGAQIDAGVWTFDIYGYVNDVTLGGSSIDIEVYKRTALSAETLLFTVNSGTLLDTLSFHAITSVQQAFAINPTDRLVIKVYGKTTALVNRTVHFVYEGTTHYSHVNTPLIIRHNDLAGLQGGNATERYHLTSTEATAVGTIGDKLDANVAIVGGTKTKITYDAKGLVTSGVNATQDDIGDGVTYKQYSDTEKSKLAGIAPLAQVNLVESASNVGSATGEVYKQLATKNLEFKTFAAGAGISITNRASTITIANTWASSYGTASPSGGSNGDWYVQD